MKTEATSSLAEATVEIPEAQLTIGDRVAEILRGKPAEAPSEKPETAPQAESSPTETWDLKTAAEKLGVDPAKFYELKVKAKDGKDLSIGELKDVWQSRTELTERESKLTAERATWQADQLRNARELEQILSAIDPAQVRPELLQAYAARQRDYVSREREAALRTIPAWGDARAEAADRAEILELVKGYGFATADLEHAHDHRLLRLVRDFAKLQARVKAAEVKPAPKVAVDPKAAKASTPAQSLGVLKTAVSKGQISQTEAVNRILGVK